MTTNEKITFAMRRYAAEIYRLQEDRQYVSLSELSEHMDTSLQAVSKMLGKFKEAGYIEHEPYRGARLTQDGLQIALPAIRRHRLGEVFLVRVMGFGWHEVHDYADQFELGIDQRLEDRMDNLCNHPTRCPHGEPIPTRQGGLPPVSDISLVERPVNAAYCISRVRIHDPEKLYYLGELGLVPGAQFSLVSIAPFNGPVRIKIGKQEEILSYELASILYVEY